MGASAALIRRVVFDTSTVVSALLFANGQLAWLSEHWRSAHCKPLVSSNTAEELLRVLEYRKFRLSPEVRIKFLALYLPYCEAVKVKRLCAVECRDPKDQAFLDLATSGNADVLVSGDADLLVLAGQVEFSIQTAKAYRNGVLSR